MKPAKFIEPEGSLAINPSLEETLIKKLKQLDFRLLGAVYAIYDDRPYQISTYAKNELVAQELLWGNKEIIPEYKAIIQKVVQRQGGTVRIVDPAEELTAEEEALQNSYQPYGHNSRKILRKVTYG